jgi:hypothetical protein
MGKHFGETLLPTGHIKLRQVKLPAFAFTVALTLGKCRDEAPINFNHGFLAGKVSRDWAVFVLNRETRKTGMMVEMVNAYRKVRFSNLRYLESQLVPD